MVAVRLGYCAAAGSAIASRKKRINLKVGLELRRECGYHRPVEEGKENKRCGNGEPKERGLVQGLLRDPVQDAFSALGHVLSKRSLRLRRKTGSRARSGCTPPRPRGRACGRRARTPSAWRLELPWPGRSR